MGINLKKVFNKSLSVNYGKSVRASPRIRWFMIILLLSIPLIVLIYKLFDEYVLVSFPGMVVYDTLTIRSPEMGYIKNLRVKVGEKITSGSALLQFSSPKIDARLQYLESEKNRITQLMDSLINANQNKLNSVLDVANKEINDSKAVYERFIKYTKQGNLIEIQLDVARRNYVDAQKQYADLQQQIAAQALQDKTTIEVNFQRKLLEINSEIRQASIQVKSFRICSPKYATVTSIQTHDGEYVSAGQNLMTLVTQENMRILAFIEPKYIDSITRGQEVEIKFPDNHISRGHIINTPSYAEQIPLTEINPLATRQNKLIAVIQPLSPLPKKYQIFQVPVKVYLQ
jgi:multidrug resistance efflux pump